MSSPQDPLLAEFPLTSYEAWREQVDKDLKGGDFQKRLVTKTLEGFDIQPLYAARDFAGGDAASGFAGLAPYRRGARPVSPHGAHWDIRVLHERPDIAQLKADIADDLRRGARSLWLRFDLDARLGRDAAAAPSESRLDGVPCASAEQLADVLSDVDLARVPLVLDAGAQSAALASFLFSVARTRNVALSQLRGSLACDPLAALARDGALPHSLEVAQSLLVELARFTQGEAPGLQSVAIDTSAYHDAGASSTQEIAYALATGATYLRWLLAAGLDVAAAARQIGFMYSVAGDLFMELAKLRAARLCWSKVVLAFGGDADAQNTTVHAITSRRTQSLRDPWVNMLRATTEAFSAMTGGADSLTTRGFDELAGSSDHFARRIARNVQVVLNEEAHVTQVADPAGGSYYVEALTEQLAREAWQLFQALETSGGMAQALSTGAVAKQIAEVADKRTAAIRKRGTALLGVSEYANLSEEPLQRTAADPVALRAAQAAYAKKSSGAQPTAALQAVAAARKQGQPALATAIAAAAAGASLGSLSAALSGDASPLRIAALPVRRNAEPYEVLRARADAHVKQTGKRLSAFLCNMGAIPKHKPRSAFATGFLQAGGIATLDNEGFQTPDEVAAAFKASGANVAVLCGSDDQYPDWVPKLAPLLSAAGAREILLAGRPGDHEAAFKQAGVSVFIFMGSDVVSTLSSLFDRLGVAS